MYGWAINCFTFSKTSDGGRSSFDETGMFSSGGHFVKLLQVGTFHFVEKEEGAVPFLPGGAGFEEPNGKVLRRIRGSEKRCTIHGG